MLLRTKSTRTLAATLLMVLATAGIGQANAKPSGKADTKASPASQAAAEARADIGKTMGFVPQFLQDFPDSVLPGTWEELKGLQLNPNTALPGKVKELIGLAVASQVPCKYCIIAHTDLAKLNGATQAEVGEAIGMAAVTRHWSTYLNGIQTDEARFRGEVAQVVANAKAAANKRPAGTAKPAAITDGAGALADISQTLGMQPEFLKRFPDSGRAGAWRTLKDLELNPGTSLSGKNKELIGLAVASQVPCKYCVVAHTEYAKLNGASDAEISEAVAMAALTRHMSTLLNGVQTDENQFRRDVDRIVRGAQAAARKEKETAARR